MNDEIHGYYCSYAGKRKKMVNMLLVRLNLKVGLTNQVRCFTNTETILTVYRCCFCDVLIIL